MTILNKVIFFLANIPQAYVLIGFVMMILCATCIVLAVAIDLQFSRIVELYNRFEELSKMLKLINNNLEQLRREHKKDKAIRKCWEKKQMSINKKIKIQETVKTKENQVKDAIELLKKMILESTQNVDCGMDFESNNGCDNSDNTHENKFNTIDNVIDIYG